MKRVYAFSISDYCLNPVTSERFDGWCAHAVVDEQDDQGNTYRRYSSAVCPRPTRIEALDALQELVKEARQKANG